MKLVWPIKARFLQGCFMPKTMLYHDILKTVYLDIKVGICITNMHISAKHKGISVTSNFTENEKFLRGN